MARNNKRFIHGTCVELCFRAQQGIPLVATDFVRTVIIGIMAAAQSLYPVEIVSVVVMGNHVHLILRVLEPSDISRFACYVKRELSHAINHWAGRSNVTNWEIGYDSPVIGSAETLIERLVYHYTNPQKADLEETIDNYPNFTTWEYFTDAGKERVEIEGRKIGRDRIREFTRFDMSAAQRRRYQERLLSEPYKAVTLVITPHAWMDCFPDSAGRDPQIYVDEVVRRVREREAELRKARNAPVLGAKKLREQSFNLTYLPKKRGRRMLILDRCKFRRAAYIEQHKEEQKQAREYRSHLPGDSPVRFPPGFFLSGGLALASLLIIATPLLHSFVT